MNRSQYFKLGLFVLTGAGVLLATALALGAGQFLEKRIPAQTLMDESVNGLEIGSPVKYRGVTIGRVNNIVFAAKEGDGVDPAAHRIARYVLIEMSLESRSFKGMSLDEIRDIIKGMTDNGLRARVAQPILGGGVYIELDFVGASAKPPPPVQPSSTALYIPSAPSTMNQVMSAADRLAFDLRQANLPQVVEHIDTLVRNVTATVGHVNEVVEANRTSAGEALADLRGTAREMHALLSTRQEDIQRIIADLRRSADNLAALSNDARENPSRLLLGSPPPRKEPGQ